MQSDCKIHDGFCYEHQVWVETSDELERHQRMHRGYAIAELIRMDAIKFDG